MAKRKKQSKSLLYVGLAAGGALFVIILLCSIGGLVVFLNWRSIFPPPPMDAATEQLVGVWEADTLDEGKSIMELRRDGTMTVKANRPGRVPVPIEGRWKVVSSQGNLVRLRRTTELGGVSSDVDILFTDRDQFTVQGDRGGAIYKRRK